MIQDHDRSGWFGASDTDHIMGNWKTKTFKSWWLTKLGLNDNHFSNRAMNAGTYYEHSILDHIGAQRKDHQIILPDLQLRVNLDGDGPRLIFEVKTHKAEKPFKVSKSYWRQVQVQIYAKNRIEGCMPLAWIVSYGLTEEDYKNFFNDIDPERIKLHHITYDPAFIVEYLERLAYLRECLLKGVFPDEIPRRRS